MSQEKYELVENKVNFCDGVIWDENFIWDHDAKISHLDNKHAIKYEGNIPSNPRLFVYSEDDFLGSGTYGSVYVAKTFILNYELKQITFKKEKVVKVSIQDAALSNEFLIGRDIKHLGIKKPVSEGEAGQFSSYLLMNKMPGKSLSELIDNGEINTLTIGKKLQLTYLLLSALNEQVVKHGVIHRDIKPDNILVQLEPELSVNIIDYGFVKKIESQLNDFCGTPNYLAPEILRSYPYTQACDVYAMAKTIIYLWIEDKSLYNRSVPLTMQNIEHFAQEVLPYLETIPTGLASLLLSMLYFDPMQRIDIRNAIVKFERKFPPLTPIVNRVLVYLEQLNAVAAGMEGQDADAEAIVSWVAQMRDILNVEKDRALIKDKLFVLLQNEMITSCAKSNQQVGSLLKSIVMKSCWLELDSTPYTYITEGLSYQTEGKWYLAFYCFFQVSRLVAADLTVYHAIADISLELGWFEQAIIYYGVVLKGNSNCISAYYGRGQANLHVNQPDKAVSDFKDALQLNAIDKSINYSMSVALFRVGEQFEATAILYYIKAIDQGYEPSKLDFEWFFTTVKKLNVEEQQEFFGICLDPKTQLGGLYAKHEEERDIIKRHLNGSQSSIKGTNLLFFKPNGAGESSVPSDKPCAPPATSESHDTYANSRVP
ncbi:protein kinase [uncultured Legionella sp.]|uniref:protein kinase family protein n=1 Tax=uncultured Legionella sp. TaxID=210934 RepID=UPI002609E694|nr:protein kinase [uncultured Legionella sp.]